MHKEYASLVWSTYFKWILKITIEYNLTTVTIEASQLII